MLPIRKVDLIQHYYTTKIPSGHDGPLGIDWLLKYSSEHYIFSISCPTLLIGDVISIITVR